MLVKKDAPRRMRGTLMIKGMSQRQLATRIGHASHTYLGRIMQGKVTSVDPETAAAIAAALELPMDDLFVPKVSRSHGRSVPSTRRAA